MAEGAAQLVKERLDILDVIGDRVRLRKAGKNWIGLCPFHKEKTPSFTVSQERQGYHCYGCGRGGDVFTFIMEAEGLDFPQALALLASRAGVELPKGRGVRRAAGLHDVMDVATKIFGEQLRAPEGAPGRAYLERRGLSLKDAARFDLGWSLSSWDALSRELAERGVTDRQALACGLVIQGDSARPYDRFRGRLMFPIRDVAGRVVAFGGRLVDGEGAKYVNSPEGELYSKRKTLYLLHEARSAIRERGRSILVEGYMDALRLHLCGFGEAVASLGTSLTEDQARALKRFSDRCYICYDSDAAGQEATIRGLYVLQGMGLDVRAVVLPSGKDPDELLRAPGGKEAFEEALEGARPLPLHHLAAVEAQLRSPEERRAGRARLFDGLVQLDPSAIAPYAPHIAGALGIYPHDLWKELDAFRRKIGKDERREEPDERPARPVGEPDRLGAALCSLLWRDASLRRTPPEEVLELLEDEREQDVAVAILTDGPDVLEERWLSTGDRWPLALIARGDAFCDELAPDAPTWDVVCEALRRRKATARLGELDAKMKRGVASPEDMMEMRDLAAELKRRR